MSKEEFNTLQDVPLRELEQRARDLTRRCLVTTDRASGFELRYEIAKILFQVRLRMSKSDGTPDYQGRHIGYRRFKKDVSKGIPYELHGTTRINFDASLRHAINIVVHENLTPEELADNGFLDRDARARSAASKRRQNARKAQARHLRLVS